MPADSVLCVIPSYGSVMVSSMYFHSVSIVIGFGWPSLPPGGVLPHGGNGRALFWQN